MKSTVDIFAEGARSGVYPGGQLVASRECTRLVTASVGLLGPGLGPTHHQAFYDLASLTKPLATTLLVGRAMEKGLMKLSDPVEKFVPTVDPKIKIEHLLDHSAGFPAHKRFDLVLPKDLTPGTWDAWRHIVFQCAKEPLISDPRKQALYSDLGFILLGAALEVAFSLPLSTAFALLGTPLVFRDRRGPPALPAQPLPVAVAPTEGCERGYVHDENARAMGGAAGHAGLFGSADGILRVAEQLVLAYHGWKGGILQPETVQRLWQPSSVKGSTRTLGWDRPSDAASSTGGRWPKNSVGHLGFTGTSIWIEPKQALIVVLVTNRVCPTRANNLIRRLRPTLYDAAWNEWAKEKSKPVPAVRTRAESVTQRIQIQNVRAKTRSTPKVRP